MTKHQKTSASIFVFAVFTALLSSNIVHAAKNDVWGYGRAPCTDIINMSSQHQQIIVGAVISGAITVGVNYHTMVSKHRLSSSVRNLDANTASEMVVNVCKSLPQYTLGDAVLRTISNLGR